MKLRIYFRPSIAVMLLGLAAAVCWIGVAVLGAGIAAMVVLAVAVFYTILLGVGVWALARLAALERWQHWETARLLILVPHEDDCVIAAGGVGARNRRLGGATRIIYLAPDDSPAMAQRRAAEARAAWRIAGVGDEDIRHLDLLPPLRQHDPGKLHRAAGVLRDIIDEFRPTVVVVPMFEGGHVHHDMTAALIARIVTQSDRFEVFEAPEYSPYASLWHTPHRILALCSRWLFGLVSYYGPPDGIDGRRIRKYRLDPADLECKRRMLQSFESQNASSLAATRCYPDRLVALDRGIERRAPFNFRWSYLRFVLTARRLFPTRMVDKLFPVQLGTIGREPHLTDWANEWNAVRHH